MRDVFKTSVEEQDGMVVAEFNFSEPNFNIVNALAKIKTGKSRGISFSFPIHRE